MHVTPVPFINKKMQNFWQTELTQSNFQTPASVWIWVESLGQCSDSQEHLPQRKTGLRPIPPDPTQSTEQQSPITSYVTVSKIKTKL